MKWNFIKFLIAWTTTVNLIGAYGQDVGSIYRDDVIFHKDEGENWFYEKKNKYGVNTCRVSIKTDRNGSISKVSVNRTPINITDEEISILKVRGVSLNNIKVVPCVNTKEGRVTTIHIHSMYDVGSLIPVCRKLSNKKYIDLDIYMKILNDEYISFLSVYCDKYSILYVYK